MINFNTFTPLNDVETAKNIAGKLFDHYDKDKDGYLNF